LVTPWTCLIDCFKAYHYMNPTVQNRPKMMCNINELQAMASRMPHNRSIFRGLGSLYPTETNAIQGNLMGHFSPKYYQIEKLIKNKGIEYV